MDDKILYLVKNGWDFSVIWSGGIYEITAWKPQWITNDLYQLRAIPSFQGETFDEAFWKLFDYIREDD